MTCAPTIFTASTPRVQNPDASLAAWRQGAYGLPYSPFTVLRCLITYVPWIFRSLTPVLQKARMRWLVDCFTDQTAAIRCPYFCSFL